MERIIYNGKTFMLHEYSEEREFEQHVLTHVRKIFGPNSLYTNIKKRFGDGNILLSTGTGWR
jgi:hypothetical protein